MGISRSMMVLYKSVKPLREPLRARLRELAAVRVSYATAGCISCFAGKAGG